LDGTHRDLRRARAAQLSIIPTSTGASEAVGRIFPDLAPHIHGTSYRVPTAVVSLLDLSARLERPASVDEVNEALREAASGDLAGILGVIDDPVVSIDLKGDTRSAIVDSLLTAAVDDSVRVVAWYDNELGYAARMIDLALHVGTRLP
jgi:glyceraldehyde 3-phosphate dehydrogenase